MNERELIECVVGAVYEVSNTLGCGFLERVYLNALCRELTLRGLAVSAETPFVVMYKGEAVGKYLPDLIVEDQLLIELKCTEDFTNQHMAQCLNYLKVSGLRTALLVNFQKPKTIWRKVSSRF